MFGFGKSKKEKEKKDDKYMLTTIQHTDEQVLTLIATLKFMINYPDRYVSKYSFYYQEIYTHKTIDIIISLHNKYEQRLQGLLANERNFTYSDEELFVLWTIINIMLQVPEGEPSQDVFSQLMNILAPMTAMSEKKYS